MVDKLVLVDSAGLRPTEALKMPEGGLKPLSPLNTRWFFDLMEANQAWATTDLGPNAFERHVQNGDSYTMASSVAEMITGHDFEDKKLGKVHAPTLVIWGRDDLLIPLPIGEALHQGIAGSQMVVIDGTGHIPMVGKPAEFNEAVGKFLNPPVMIRGHENECERPAAVAEASRSRLCGQDARGPSRGMAILAMTVHGQDARATFFGCLASHSRS